MGVPSFTKPVPPGGYSWWYLDAVSDDNQHAITVIVFIGSVFSPYYARARKKGVARADDHCSVNVALYGSPSRWCMTERTAASLHTTDRAISIGRSSLQLHQQQMIINIDEVCVPIPRRLRGTLTIELPDYDLAAHALDAPESPAAQLGEHIWQPIAPQTRINVRMNSPDLSWQGAAYVDSNHGRVPLESSFRSWVWSRSHASNGDTTVLYDVIHRDGQSSQRSLHFSADGTLTQAQAPQRHTLASTRYFRISRSSRTVNNVGIKDLRTLEDTPFYSRSRFVEQHKASQRTTVHESLDLNRFDSAWVRTLLPFRMPRSTRPLLLG